MTGEPYKVPSYETFSHKGLWQLEELEKALAKKGLSDPWIRNEAWRYNPAFGNRWTRAKGAFFRGLPLGFGLAVITTAIGMAFGSKDSHHH